MKPAPIIALALALALGGGLILVYLQPWVRDVTAISSQEFADEMNALTGPQAPDTSSRAARMIDALTRIHTISRDLDKEVMEREDFNIMKEGDELPSSSLMLVLEGPPRQVPQARACVARFESTGLFAELEALSQTPPLPLPWLPDTPIPQQLTDHIFASGRTRAATRALIARMRLADLDQDWDRSTRSARAALWLGTSIDLHPVLIDVLAGARLRAGVLEELRCQILEHMPEQSLAACESMLAALSFDQPAWLARIDRVARGEGLFSNATAKETLESSPKLNTRVNRRRAHDDFELALADFRAAAALPPDQPIVSADLDVDRMVDMAQNGSESIEEAIEQSRRAVFQTARVLRAERVAVSALRALVAIERHRLRHHALPATLDALDPAAILTPPPSFQTIVYRPAPNGTFVLYAFGPDAVDNGGEPGISWFVGIGTDAVFTLPRKNREPMYEGSESKERER